MTIAIVERYARPEPTPPPPSVQVYDITGLTREQLMLLQAILGNVESAAPYNVSKQIYEKISAVLEHVAPKFREEQRIKWPGLFNFSKSALIRLSAP